MGDQTIKSKNSPKLDICSPDLDQILDPNTRYKMHPAIGIARVGNSPEDFYLAPETEGGLPIACSPDGSTPQKETNTTNFKDDKGRIRRQAARFKIFAYDKGQPLGREIAIGDTIVGEGSFGALVDIEWTAWLANKKASWYQFQQLTGSKGYDADHPLRNEAITGDDRTQLIIDPGSQTIYSTGLTNTPEGQLNKPQRPTSAAFTKGKNQKHSQNFPPPLLPHSIDTLGDMNTVLDTREMPNKEGKLEDKQYARLVIRGGMGHAGVAQSGPLAGQEGPAGPIIRHYANNKGWFDDISDGPVTAKLIYRDENAGGQLRYVAVHDPSWLIVGYPSYAPNIVDMITMNETMYDVFVREMAHDTSLYGRQGTFDKPEKINLNNHDQLITWRDAPKEFNPEYFPLFWRDIWPILTRPENMQWTTSVLATSNDAHGTSNRGDFAQNRMAIPPTVGEDGKIIDPFKYMRYFIYSSLRRPGENNQLDNNRDDWALRPSAPQGSRFAQFGKELMPLLCGDNPITNNFPDKFLVLTECQLFFLKQWAIGKFINEKSEEITIPKGDGQKLDEGVLANALGGAFCPGGETAWNIRNPNIYKSSYRVKIDPDYYPNMTSRTVKTTLGVTKEFQPPALTNDGNISNGLQPGDLTKYSALPWQADFNECTTQGIDVTYEQWNSLSDENDTYGSLKDRDKSRTVLWWPSHRPLQVYERQTIRTDDKVKYSYSQVDWSRTIPQTMAGDLRMVSDWWKLGFLVENQDAANSGVGYIEQPGSSTIDKPDNNE